MCKTLFLINLGFNLVYFITINSNVPLTSTARKLYNLQAFQYCRSSSFMVHLCMLSVDVRQHHMAELLVIIKVLPLEINLLALTVLSDLESMFTSFIPYCIEQQPCVLSANKNKYSINSNIKNKVNLGSKLIFNIIFQNINLN